MAPSHEPDPPPVDGAGSVSRSGHGSGTESGSSAGGDRTAWRAALPPLEVARVVARIDAATPFVVVTGTPTPDTTWVADVIASARAGADPLAAWRTALRGQQEQQSRPEPPPLPEPPPRGARQERPGPAGPVPVPPHLPAAFVLQWWCEVVATPIAHAAALGPWVLVPEPRALGFELAPGLYPTRIVVLPEHTGLEVEPDPPRRWQRARAAYDAIVEPVVRGFAPEVRMGSRQRWGVVDDMWQTAARRAAGAAGESVGPEPMRTSCCFIFVLPGLHECSSCPRHGRR